MQRGFKWTSSTEQDYKATAPLKQYKEITNT